MQISLGHLDIQNPKQSRLDKNGSATWFPYYAGFSSEFARRVLSTAQLPAAAKVLDPWNGAGTTTANAQRLGYSSIGLDLNPVMVIASKARILSPREKNSLAPLAAELVAKASSSTLEADRQDPLCEWLIPSSAAALRRIEEAVQTLLTGTYVPGRLQHTQEVDDLSDLASFYYTALFRTVRDLVGRFIPTNPTWIRRPQNLYTRSRPRSGAIFDKFSAYVSSMAASLDGAAEQTAFEQTSILRVSNSERIPLCDGSVDLVLSSPPYCTRIDYAIATLPELAILGYAPGANLETLRRALIGTSTVPVVSPPISDAWGGTCVRFLEMVARHRSKASRSYYLKSHAQYFSSMFHSLTEIARVLKAGGLCVVVVQDSYYKDIHNDVPTILSEMMVEVGMSLERRIDFKVSNSRAYMHPEVKRYRRPCAPVESVLACSKAPV
jgi:DNA modification methylase